MKKIVNIVLLACLSATMTQAQLKVRDLRVEHNLNPSVVDVTTPRLSWINEAANEKLRGQRQTAYQIVVASSCEKLAKGEYDVWDTGKTCSEESNLIAYGGPELQSAKDYYWQVRTWNQDDKVSAWSPASHWGMGLKNEEWTAQWISAQKDGFEAPLLRKGFTTHKKVQQAKVFICGLGFFELYVNGSRIGEDYLVPNLSNYGKRYDLDKQAIALDGNFRDYRVLYMAYDVTAQLKQGENMLGVMLGNGWYHPDQANASTYGQSCLRCQMMLTYTDGTTEMVLSDGSWKEHTSPILYSGIYRGEQYDANLEVKDWAVPGSSEEGWNNVKVVEGPSGQMTAMTSPADKITETLRPTSIQKTGDKTFEVTFDKEISGWIHFTGLKGHKGETLCADFIHGTQEGLNPYASSLRYTFKDEEKVDYRPSFTWFVFDKVRITGIDNLTEQDLVAEAVNTDVPVTAEFVTSNPLFNRINEIWQRSQLDNMHGCVASDCPHRERLPYTGDGEAACETVILNFDAAPFYQKWIRDMRDSQNRDTGYEPNGAPWAPGCGGGVAWGAAMTLMPWWFYVQYGDQRMLEDSYLNMKEQVRYMLNWITLDGIMFQKKRNYNGDEAYWLNLGDWCPPNGLPRDELVHTFYLWQCADFCARAARVLQQKEEADSYQAMADKVAANFHRYFYNAEEKTYGKGGCNIYALRMGVPEAYRQEVLKTTRHEIMEEAKGHITTGFLGTKYFFETLSENGMHDVAYTVMNKKDFPSYGWWIEQGATTTWEEWSGANSHNHPMFGSGLTWFYRTLAGVNADEAQPGYRHIILRPQLTDLEQVRYSQRTPYGRVLSQITQKDGRREMLVTVPVGSTATLYLPATDVLKEGGKPLEKVQGITQKGQEKGETELELQQGTYRITF